MKRTSLVSSAALSAILLSWMEAGESRVAAQPIPASGPPLTFVPNEGQLDPEVKFVARGSGYQAILTERGAVVSAGGRERLRFQLSSSARPGRIEGLERLPGVVNVYRGSNSAEWRRGLPTYARVRYPSAYPGIDVVFYGNPRQLEFDFLVAPGADPSVIRLSFPESEDLLIEDDGDLSIQSEAGSVRLERPAVYQDRESGRRPIAGRYVLAGPGEVRFQLEDYDRALPLVIDPTLLLPLPTMGDGRLTVSSYLPAGDDVIVVDGAFDSEGNFLLVATTRADDVGTDTPPDPGRAAGEDLVVLKIDRAGSAVAWSTYLGGENRDAAGGIAVDRDGNVFVVGTSDSPDFPIAGDPVQPVKSGLDDAVIASLDPNGDLLASTFFGGSGSDPGVRVNIGEGGDVFVTGSTTSSNFPVTVGAFQTTFGGVIDGYVAKLSPGLDAVQYATFLGGVSTDSPSGIAVAGDGSVAIVGNTLSGNFPTRNPAQATNQGFQDAFVTKLDPTGSDLIFSTFVGGSGPERALAVNLDSGSDYISVVGETKSAAPFPRDGVVPDSAPEQTDGFFAQYDSNGLLAFLAAAGGTGPDSLRAVDTDPATGDVLVAGSTASTDLTLVDSIQPGLNSTGMGIEPRPGATFAAVTASFARTTPSVPVSVDSVSGSYVEIPRANERFPVAVIAAQIDGDDQTDAVYLFDGPPDSPQVSIVDGLAGVDRVVELTVNGGTDVAALPGDLPGQNDLVVAGSGGLLALSGIGGGVPSVAVLPGTAGVLFDRLVAGVAVDTGDELVVAARRMGDGPDSEVITYLNGAPVRVFPMAAPTTDLALDASREPPLVAVATETSVAIFEGDALLQNFPFAPASLRGLALGDLNGDGELDLLVTAPSSGRMLLGTSGTLRVSPQTIPTGPGPRLPVAADFDRDDFIDVGFLGGDGTFVTLMNQTPQGSSEPRLVATSTKVGSFVGVARSAAVIPRAGETPAVAAAGVAANDNWYGVLPQEGSGRLLAQGVLGSRGIDDLRGVDFRPNGSGGSTVALSGQTQQRLPEGGFGFQAPLVAAFDLTANPQVPSLSIRDASVREGDISGVLGFEVTLSEPSDGTMSVQYSVTDGSAQAPVDYQQESGTIFFPAGVTSIRLFITVFDDALHEGNETLQVTLSNPQNATIADGDAIGTVLDDDPPPNASIADVSADEGNAGTRIVELPVTLDVPSGLPASVDFATSDGTATAGEDYEPLSGTLTFEPGETTRTIQVVYTGDTLSEFDETVTITLSNPVNAVIGDNVGTVTFLNDDPHPNAFITDASVDEGDAGTRIVIVPVTLSAPSGLRASVDFETSDGTATAGEDYVPAAGTLTFEPGQTTGTIQVIYNGDAFPEPDETLTITLSNPVNVVLTDNRGTVTFFNDDVRPPPTVAAQVQTPVVEEGGTAQVLVTATAGPSDAFMTGIATWGDGTPDTSFTIPLSGGAGAATISHVYQDDGELEGAIRVTDLSGFTVSTNITITAVNVDPAVNAGPDQTIVPGQPVTVNGTIEDPGASDSFTVEIDWDGDGIFDEVLTRPAGSTTFTATHVYDAVGATATFRVIDDDGGVGTDSVTFTGELPTMKLLYVDVLAQTTTVLPFKPGGLSAIRIASAQYLFLLARRLCDLGFSPVCSLAAQALAALDFLVPPDSRYVLRAPDPSAGALSATLTSRDANGSPIQSHPIELAPTGGGSVDSRPFVVVPRGGRILSGGFGPLLFVSAEVQGSLLAEAETFETSLASVCRAFLLTAKRPLGSLVYDPPLEGSIESPGKEECFGVQLDSAQTLTAQVVPDDSGLQPVVELSGPDGTSLAARTAPTPGGTVFLQSYPIGQAGTYRIDVRGAAATVGDYIQRLVLNAGLEEEPAGGANDSVAAAQAIDGSFSTLFGDAGRGAVLGAIDPSGTDIDFFSFRLEAAHVTTIAISNLSDEFPTEEVDISLFDSGGNEIASSSPGGNVDRHVFNFTAPAAGAYYVQATGDPGVDYSLLLTRNAVFDVGQPQGQAVVPIAGNRVALGFLGGSSTSEVQDFYAVGLLGGQVLEAFTQTPADGPGQFQNSLNPRLRLLDGSGQEVATGVVLADGRNESLTFAVPGDGGGPYTIAVSAEGGTRGEYTIVLK